MAGLPVQPGKATAKRIPNLSLAVLQHPKIKDNVIHD